MITINGMQIMIEHFIEIIHVTASEVQIQMKSYTLALTGVDLHVLALSKDEILVAGTLEGVKFLYET